MSEQRDANEGWLAELDSLLERHPRATWPTARSASVAFWLDVHERLRRDAAGLDAAGDEYRSGRSSPAQLAVIAAPRLRGLVAAVQGHHRIEDFEYFPEFRRAEPRLAPGFDRLEREHTALSRSVDAALTALAALRAAAERTEPASTTTLKLAAQLYDDLLRPLESGWKPAKNLIVVTNGALGLLPLSLLPTATAEVKTDDDPLFVSYRNVPWLARSHAVTAVPSAAALRTLRQIPPGSDKRERLVGFGDPIFSKEQEVKLAALGADTTVAMATTRGVVGTRSTSWRTRALRPSPRRSCSRRSRARTSRGRSTSRTRSARTCC